MKRFVLMLALLVAVQWAAAQPAQIILIRHAEKPDSPDAVHLSKAGEKRAKNLVPFITSDAELTKYGLPVALFATGTTKHGRGQRTQETITPLATELKLPVEAPYQSENYGVLAKMILANRQYEGKTVLICWNHEEIPQLAAALGVHPQPPKWKDNVYDRVYLISYHDGKATLQDLPQKLSPKGGKPRKHQEKIN